MTPFQALYGYIPPIHGYHDPNETVVASVETYMQQRKVMRSIVKESLENAQSRMKVMADKHRTEREFKVGDWVYLRLQPYKQVTVALRKNLKLSARYFGPFQVEARIGKVAYRLQLPSGSKVHPVFHVSQLKKKLGKNKVPIQSLPYADDDGNFRIEPIAVVDRRLVKRNNKPVNQVLVQWSNSTPEDATWEDYNFITSQFPNFKP